MIPRRLRLSRKDFESVVRGKELMRALGPHFSISYGPAPEGGGCGIVVPKKVEKSSVKRHLLKRRIREVLKGYCSSDRVLIVYARPGSEKLSFEELSKELSEQIEQQTA